MADLGTVPGRSTSTGTAISADGSVVAGFDEAGAVIWTEATGMMELASYLSGHGVNLAGWTLRACYGISADGTAMVGTGRFNGPVRGWVVRGLPSVCAPIVTSQPGDTAACPTGNALFAVTVAGGEGLAYEWQIETSPRSWTTLGLDPSPLPCGGFAFALEPFSPETRIGVRGCETEMRFNIRCVVTNACGSASSEAAVYTVCAADLNCDGAPNSQDYFDFLASFFEGSENADFNSDGAVNSQDYFDFLAAFFSGC